MKFTFGLADGLTVFILLVGLSMRKRDNTLAVGGQ